MKSKFLKPALALVLVAAMAVGGSLAYISATTDQYVNTFTVNNKLAIELTETFKVNEDVVADTDDTDDYVGVANFVPGDEILKAPVVEVTDNDLTEGAYLFIELTGDVKTIVDLGFVVDTSWTVLNVADDSAVYYKELAKDVKGTHPVFSTDKVTIPEDYTATQIAAFAEAKTLTVDSWAIQAANFDDAADAYAAK